MILSWLALTEAQYFDVAVVGAGPAGCSAARALAEKGVKVVLIEKASLPRYKTCGGGILARAYHLLPTGVHSVVEREVRSVSLSFFGTGLNFVATRASPLIYMTMRAELDSFLARQAEKAGAKVVDSCPVRSVTLRDDVVEISGEAGRFQARFVIGADGVHSAVAKATGWSELPHLAPALEWEVFLTDGEFERFSSNARFDFNVVEAGYAWVLPKRDHLSIGILSMRRRCTDLQARLEDYLRGLGISEPRRVERNGHLIPVAPRREELARGRVLLVGDAAGLVDPVTAEGISNAIMSGQLAAAALLESQLVLPEVARRYGSLLRNSILGELRTARFLADFLYNHPRIRGWAFRHQGKRLTNFVADVVMGERDYTSALSARAKTNTVLAGRTLTLCGRAPMGICAG